MIYLASPYTHEDEEIMNARFEEACTFCAKQARAGVVIYSPIVHWHPVAWRCDLPRDHEFWKFHDHEMIRLCTEFWVLKLDDWIFSKGVAADSDFAESIGRKVVYIEP